MRSRRWGSPHHVFLASIAAYVGLDPSRDINFVTYPAAQSMQLLAGGKIDALLSFPPIPQELRAKKIGHLILNSSVDRPWSQYFCCMISGNREFLRKNPVATKRAMRALLKAVDVCVTAPERAARVVADRGFPYDYSLLAMREIPYAKWRDYDPAASVSAFVACNLGLSDTCSYLRPSNARVAPTCIGVRQPNKKPCQAGATSALHCGSGIGVEIDGYLPAKF